MLKHTMKAALVAAAMTSAGATAAFADDAAAPAWGSITGSLAVTSDYVFRGHDQFAFSSGPAIQGALTYTHPTGIYAGVWMSNTDYTPNVKVETDLSIGISNTIGNFKYDLGWVYYLYPGAKDDNNPAFQCGAPGCQGDANYYEFYGKAGYDFGFVQLLGSVYGTPAFQFGSGAEIYYNANVTVPVPFLPWNTSISGWYGYTVFLDNARKDASFTDYYTDYADMSIGVGFTIPYGGIGVDLRYITTNLNNSIIGPHGAAPDSASQGEFVATFTKSF
jgi:uncharacterized protein (TIGR02001 family)